MKYHIEIKRSAVKEIQALQRNDAKVIMHKIADLAHDPRPHGCIRLSGDEKYRIRWGDYRILYSIEDVIRVVCIVKVGHRKDVYH